MQEKIGKQKKMRTFNSVIFGLLIILAVSDGENTTGPAGTEATTAMATMTNLGTTPETKSTTTAEETAASGASTTTTVTTTNNTTPIATDATATEDGSGVTVTSTATTETTTAVTESATTTAASTTTTSQIMTTSESTTVRETTPQVTTTTTNIPETTAPSTVARTTIVTSTAPPLVTTTTTTKTTSASPPNQDNVILAVCLTFFIIVLIVFAIVLYFYCTGRDLPCLKGRRGSREIITNDISMRRKPSGRPKFAVGHMYIDEEDFEAQFKRKTADDGRGYREEYRAIQTEGGTMASARDPENTTRNRYDNVLPWDSTRVILSVPPNGDPNSDYINANYVPGYLQEKKFIACQGPKENTCADFWKMIWEQKCATIVMTTNLIEAKKVKCHQYWPGDDTTEGATAKYGNFTVTLVDVKVRNFYATRTLKLQLYEHPPRMIRQLHYTAWPDFGVPKNPHELLLFRRRVIAANPPHSGPIVVHCSAGVGRTGTYILIDAALEQLKAEGKVDLFSFLTKMRKYRMMLVQTDAQYTFAHAAILHHIKYGETEVSVKKFRNQVQSLKEPVEDLEETLLETQFSTLLKVPQNKDNMKHGRTSIKKNRVLQIIPFDDNRVTLPLKPGQEKSDYINASFIDGFKEKRAYIATQGPLAETTADFWSMLWVYQVPNIVMLTALVEKGQQMCAQYWPSEVNGEETYGDITVKFVSQDDDDVVDYTVREFVLTNPGSSDDERRVRQFHYTGWPEVGLPTDAHGMIEIANRLSSKDKDGYPRPIVVHCSSGGGRTGVFLSLTILMEQADSEGMVDVFQTAKTLRAQRPHIIQTQDQFYFCYEALLQYLETNQMADDSTTLTSNINSSIGNQSQSVTPSNGAIPVSPHTGAEENTPQGSMHNKLDCNSVTGTDTVVVEMKVPDTKEEDILDTKEEVFPDSPQKELEDPTVATAENQSTETQSGDSVNQALLKEAIQSPDNSASNSSASDFEVVNETNNDTEVKV